ncbi:AAA family ATPase [Epidermidibacterium keratini]
MSGTDSVAVRILANDEHVSLHVAGESAEVADQTIELLWSRIEETIVAPSESRVQIQLRANRNGRTVELPCPAWSEIQTNYMPVTRAGIGNLAALETFSANAGKLIVWHGQPGTGKTTAIRALARAWDEWCDPIYISDPEIFFGNSEYLTEVIWDAIDSGRRARRSAAPARLVIAEDCDDYLHADAKIRTGGGLGRLLNLTDGLLGLGQRVLVLITTNEPLRRLHPALARPGRVLSDVEFLPFSATAAKDWGVETKVPLTLAEMYAARDSESAPLSATARRGVGFEI